MPAATSAAFSWRDSWPPSHVHLDSHTSSMQHMHAKAVSSLDGKSMDALADGESPLAYFLTPDIDIDDYNNDYNNVDDDDDDDDDGSYYTHEPFGASADADDADADYGYGYGFGYSTGLGSIEGFDFDAGIEDDDHPVPDVRSVSPSVLAETMFSGALARPPTPPRRRADADPSLDFHDDDDDDKDNDSADHFATFGYTFGARPIRIANTNNNRCGKTVTRKTGVSSMRAPSSSASSDLARAASIPRRRSPRAWRVPSPDVFVIAEEPEPPEPELDPKAETETESETRSSLILASTAGSELDLSRSAAPTPASDALPTPSDHAGVGSAFLEAAVAKRRLKRVRFVLPG